MPAIRWIVLFVVGVLVGACGLVVPEIQESPTDQAGGQLLVKAIVNSVHCEVKNVRVGFESHEARAIRRTSSMIDAA